MKIVLSVGGSILVPGDIDKEYIEKLSVFLNDLKISNQVAVVTGGGRLARKYIEVARGFNAPEVSCDLIGIGASRLNARVLSAALGDSATREPPLDFHNAGEELERGRIVVMGGTHPGHSTDAVAALLAEYIGADLLINASDVDGIYNKDPQRSKNAVLYEELSVKELLKIVGRKSLGAGRYELLDILAAKIIERSGIKTIFLNGRDLDNMRRAMSGKEFKGTVVTKE